MKGKIYVLLQKIQPYLNCGDNRIYNINVIPNITNTKILDGKIIYEGEAKVKVIFESDNMVEVESKTVGVPFTKTLEIEGVNPNSNVDTAVEVKREDFVIESSGNVSSNMSLEFNSQVYNRENINILDDINANEEMKEDTYSMVVYFVKPNDTLWKIAKQFRSTVDDIARINGIENEKNLAIGKQLFIPRYNYRVTA